MSCSARSRARETTSSRRVSSPGSCPVRCPWPAFGPVIGHPQQRPRPRRDGHHGLRRALRASTCCSTSQCCAPSTTGAGEPMKRVIRSPSAGPTTGTCTCAMARRWRAVLPHTAGAASHARIVMPNLKPPVKTSDGHGGAVSRGGSSKRVPPGLQLRTPDDALPDRSHAAGRGRTGARASGIVHGFKLYPAGATTHSDCGRHRHRAASTRYSRAWPTVAWCCRCTARSAHNSGSTCSTRVRASSTRVLCPAGRARTRGCRRRVRAHHHPPGRAVRAAAHAPGVAATITPQHLLHNRNAMFAGGIRPHFYCLPVLKTEPDRVALLGAATSGEPRFFLGTDSAPHARPHQGKCLRLRRDVYGARRASSSTPRPSTPPARWRVSRGFGARPSAASFYGLPRNTGTITLRRARSAVPASFASVPTRNWSRWRAGRRHALVAGRGAMNAAVRASSHGSLTGSAASCRWSSTSRREASTTRPMRCSKLPPS